MCFFHRKMPLSSPVLFLVESECGTFSSCVQKFPHFFMQVVYLFIYVMQEESFWVVHKHQNYLYDVLAVCVIQFVLTVGRLNSFICKVKYYFMQQVLLYSPSYFFFPYDSVHRYSFMCHSISFFFCVCKYRDMHNLWPLLTHTRNEKVK